MPRPTKTDWRAVDALLDANERVVTHGQLIACGMLKSTISRRIRPGGPWQRGAPGVVIAHSGTPTRRELELVGLSFAGPGSMITGADALHAHGAKAPARTDPVRLLIPMSSNRKSFGQFVVERTSRMPKSSVRHGIPYAPAFRAVVDLCRHTPDLDKVRGLVAGTVQRRRATIDEIRDEIHATQRQRTALPRIVLYEVSAGIRSVAEAKVREIMAKLGIRPGLWNVRLFNEHGALFLSPDCYWPDLAAAIEIDSLEFHLAPADFRRTRARERRLTLNGVLVLSFTPGEILADPEAFGRALLALLEMAANRPVPPGLTWRRADDAA